MLKVPFSYEPIASMRLRVKSIDNETGTRLLTGEKKENIIDTVVLWYRVFVFSHNVRLGFVRTLVLCARFLSPNIGSYQDLPT
jgi:hypothetical protein